MEHIKNGYPIARQTDFAPKLISPGSSDKTRQLWVKYLMKQGEALAELLEILMDSVGSGMIY